MARLTRAESQAQTRDRLIATAKRAFLRDGYAATTLEKVADEAGYSKGAVYSNFRNKDELCLAVLDAIHTEQMIRIGTAIAGTGTLDERLAAFQRWADDTIGERSWTALEVEFAIHTRHDPRLRDELARRDEGIRAVIAGVLAEGAAEFGLRLPMPAQDLATALLSLGIGLGVRRAIDPSIPASVLTDTIRALAGRPSDAG
ncbi:MAG TPA: TetR/AcrR family transcriptional regulator [Pseudonocardiaceae bacterium]|jgi:AcrR family transcriptional regulator|nr:TetR/AcrR family transcriptional regulator [Pseudonocardiaceae bacterium]